jgi:pSer/pThr/pTyr-binding forkhead associated (FHA) protein
LIPILHFMGGSAAEMPASPGDQPPSGLRASDAERDQVVAKLRDEFVAGRLSHDTFLHRVGVVLQSRRQADLPPVVADLPAQPAPRSLARWLRGTWHRVTGAPRAAGDRSSPGPSSPRQSSAVLRATTNHPQMPARTEPYPLQFPRGDGSSFSIGRDANCDLAISDMSVSRRHAQLDRTQDGWLLSDLSSTNGTRLNGWRVRGQVPVRPGDLVRFGDLEVFFLRGDDPAALSQRSGPAVRHSSIGRQAIGCRRFARVIA